MIEIEPFGVDYERYSLSKCLGSIVKRYKICTCAELPAHGAKAMPSIYSLGLAQAGTRVTLINPSEHAQSNWEKVQLDHLMTIAHQDDIYHTSFPNDSFDMAWNFAYFPTALDPKLLLSEMKRISSRYIAIFSVNGLNIGAYIHRTLHRVLNIPWTHGNINFNFPGRLARFMRLNGLSIVRIGVTDCPFWPDSLGFRDVRLHRLGVVEMSTEWKSNTLEWMKTRKYPRWIQWVYAFESIRTPLFIKYFYSHIFYIIGEKKDA